jgi:Fe-S cluster assembly protein SufD
MAQRRLEATEKIMAAETLKTKSEQDFANQFTAGKSVLPGAGNAWAEGLREAAWENYASAGLPHRRVEEWKYTDLRVLLKKAFPPAPALAEALNAQDVSKALGSEMASLDCHRLVIVDGQFRPELSDLGGLEGRGEVQSLGEALSDPSDWLKDTLTQVIPSQSNTVVALNTALMTGGIALRIEDDAELEKPVHIVHLFAAKDAASVISRNVISIGAGAKVTLLESYVSQGSAPAQRNVVSELIAGDSSHVHHIKFQNETLESAHLTSWMTRLGAGVTYNAFQFSLGAAVARNQIFVTFAGEGSTSHVSGAVMVRGKQHNDTTMVIDHAVPGCESREFNKLVLDGSARGIVQCKAIVQRDAQKTDGHQMAHALLLSETAEFDSKPELEIFADDVVCGHGSTSGQVDDELMFYLRARGIPEPQARALLIAAFVGEAIEKVSSEPIREAFVSMAEAWLASEGA